MVIPFPYLRAREVKTENERLSKKLQEIYKRTPRRPEPVRMTRPGPNISYSQSAVRREVDRINKLHNDRISATKAVVDSSNPNSSKRPSVVGQLPPLPQHHVPQVPSNHHHGNHHHHQNAPPNPMVSVEELLSPNVFVPLPPAVVPFNRPLFQRRVLDSSKGGGSHTVVSGSNTNRVSLLAVESTAAYGEELIGSPRSM
eukprot:PhF_6_TR15699/c1_g1_i1/m.24428